MERKNNGSKCWLLVLIWVFAVSLGCAGPEKTAGVQDKDAPIGATSIVVATDLGPDEAYRHAGRVLQSQGYGMQESDSKLRSITTAPKSGSDVLGPIREMSVSVMVRTGPTRYVLTARSSGQQVKKFGQSGSPMRKTWAELHRLANEMGQVTEYSTSD